MQPRIRRADNAAVIVNTFTPHIRKTKTLNLHCEIEPILIELAALIQQAVRANGTTGHVAGNVYVSQHVKRPLKRGTRRRSARLIVRIANPRNFPTCRACVLNLTAIFL